jgi:UDP-N-acetylmuramyl pentapeptide phosphotransferase/UDP-N-acetylglucosamine-1-phosphate transferase
MNDLPYGLSYGFTFLVIVGLTNAINLIDGLDGLAGTIILIASVSFGIYFYQTNGNIFHPYATVAFCLAGAIIGFLRYNLRKAIIFMGDTGSLVCGLLLSVMAIQFVQMRPFPGSPVVAIAVLIIPIFDTVRVFTMRILSGKSPFSPDKNHIHHVLMELGLSQMGVVATLACVNITCIVLIRQLTFLGNNILLASLVSLMLLMSIILEILLARKRSKKHATAAVE